MAGLERQNENFWKYIKGYDFIGLSETWIMEKRWGEIKNWLPDTHICSKHAKKEKVKGRAKGGIVIGLRKDGREGESEFIESGHRSCNFT